MSTAIAIIVICVVLAAILTAGAYLMRSRQLQRRFGPEYGRAVERAGSRRRGERELARRQRRHASLHLRPLDAAARETYTARWREVQARFVEAPEDALNQAENLITEVMTARGYPAEDFDQRIADLSVDHGSLVERYRTAHALRTGHAGRTDTEGLRQALVDHRELFTALLDGPGEDPTHHGGAHTAAAVGDPPSLPARTP
ncbi:MAG: hypothetical protein WCA46_01630, partial [Actinocatenispora sp.]